LGGIFEIGFQAKFFPEALLLGLPGPVAEEVRCDFKQVGAFVIVWGYYINIVIIIT
jgi:hypothetical protein